MIWIYTICLSNHLVFISIHVIQLKVIVVLLNVFILLYLLLFDIFLSTNKEIISKLSLHLLLIIPYQSIYLYKYPNRNNKKSSFLYFLNKSIYLISSTINHILQRFNLQLHLSYLNIQLRLLLLPLSYCLTSLLLFLYCFP